MSSVMRVLGVCVACSFALHVSASTGSEPTEQEWRKVLAGKHVVRPLRQQTSELDLIGGIAWQRVEAPPDVVWDTVTRPELYRALLPYAVDAQPIDAHDVVVRHRVIFGEVSYRIRLAPDPATRTLRFSVPQPGGALRAGWGELQVRPLGDAACVVSWNIMADPDVGLLGKLFDGVVQRTMLEVPVRVRKYVHAQQSVAAR